MLLPFESTLRCERAAFVATIESLRDEEFDNGRTLCEGWAPRDVLAHVLGMEDEPGEYVRARGNLTRAHAAIVAKARSRSRADLTARARAWAAQPSLLSRLVAGPALQDVAVHHQDVLRGLGRGRTVPRPVAAAILREGVVLGAKRLLSYRVEPTDGIGRALGRGRVVRGTTEALGMWLAGREEVALELHFVT